MIWIDDLALLEPSYLATSFRPQENGIASEDIAAALSGCKPQVRRYLFGNIDTSLRLEVLRVAASTFTHEKILQAQLRLVGVYFWELVYRKYPSEYDRFTIHQRLLLHRLFPLNAHKDHIVLDIGCGTGRLVGHFASHVTLVYGLDPIVSMLRIADEKYRQLANVKFIGGKVQSIPLRDESVDVIVSNLAFQYSEHGGGRAGLSEMRRVLRPLGEIRMTVGNSRTQDFLLDNGFKEDFVPHGVRLDVPPDASPVVRCMYELAIRVPPQTSGRHYLRPAAPTKLHWMLANLLAAMRGFPWKQLFENGNLRAPLGIPVYVYRKPKGHLNFSS